MWSVEFEVKSVECGVRSVEFLRPCILSLQENWVLTYTLTFGVSSSNVHCIVNCTGHT